MSKTISQYPPFQYPFRAAFDVPAVPIFYQRSYPSNTPVVTPLTAAQLANQMAQEMEAQSGTSGRFYKTRLCLFNLKGACVKGSSCSYAHSENELRPAPDLVKTRLCQEWLNGLCVDPGCKFAHGRQELRFTHDFYKTKICHFWQHGGCTKGSLCRHAHGSHELRPVPEGGTASSAASTRRHHADDENSTRSSNPGGRSPGVTPSNASAMSPHPEAVTEAMRLAADVRSSLVSRPGDYNNREPIDKTSSFLKVDLDECLPALYNAPSGLSATTAPSLQVSSSPLMPPADYSQLPSPPDNEEDGAFDKLIETLLMNNSCEPETHDLIAENLSRLLRLDITNDSPDVPQTTDSAEELSSLTPGQLDEIMPLLTASLLAGSPL